MSDSSENRKVIESILEAYASIRDELFDRQHGTDAILTMLQGYIETHRWLINEKIPSQISLEQAFFSWYENVYRPIWTAIDSLHVLKAFPGSSPIEVFDFVSTALLFSEQNKERITLTRLIHRVVATKSPRFWSRFRARLLLGNQAS